jgi:hypothetical protein
MQRCVGTPRKIFQRDARRATWTDADVNAAINAVLANGVAAPTPALTSQRSRWVSFSEERIWVRFNLLRPRYSVRDCWRSVALPHRGPKTAAIHQENTGCLQDAGRQIVFRVAPAGSVDNAVTEFVIRHEALLCYRPRGAVEPIPSTSRSGGGVI